MVKTQAWFLPLVTGISDSIEYGTGIFLEGKCQETAEVWYFNLYGFMRGGGGGGGGRKPQHSISGLLEFSAQNQNQNCLLVIRPRTIIHQDLCLGKLVPSPHKRSKLSNWIYCTLRSSDKGICHKIMKIFAFSDLLCVCSLENASWIFSCFLISTNVKDVFDYWLLRATSTYNRVYIEG